MTIIAADMSLNPVKGIRLSDGTWIAKDTHLYMSNNRGDDPTNGFTSGEIIGSEAYLNIYAAASIRHTRSNFWKLGRSRQRSKRHIQLTDHSTWMARGRLIRARLSVRAFTRSISPCGRIRRASKSNMRGT